VGGTLGEITALIPWCNSFHFGFLSPLYFSSKHPHQEPPFLWSGGICRRHIALEANATRTLTVHASFGRPGVYNLNTLRVLVMMEGGSYHPQRWQRTSYITIE